MRRWLLSVCVAATIAAGAGLASASASSPLEFWPVSPNSGPSLSCNFLAGAQSNQIPGSISVGPRCPTITFTRASGATSGLYTDAAGSSYTNYPTNVPRLMPQGFLRELQSSENYLLNSDTPTATQIITLGTGSFTLWVIGSGSAAVTLGTALGTGTGTATAGSPNIFTITTGGTVVVTKTGTLTRYQLEPLAFPTSYIPTTGSAATRAAESATITAGGWLNPNAGTMVVTVMWPFISATVNMGTVSIDDTTNNNWITIFHASGHSDVNGYVEVGGTIIMNSESGGSVSAGTAFTAGISFGRSTSPSVVLNGGTPISGSTAGMPGGLTRLIFGHVPGGGSLSGFIQSLVVYRQAMPSGQLQRAAP